MKYYRILVVVTCVMLLSVLLRGQRTYRTLDYMAELVNSTSGINGGGSAIASFSEVEINQIEFENKIDNYELKVIFHVINSPVSISAMIGLINQQMTRLNQDFASANNSQQMANDPDGRFYRKGVDTKISFCLANPGGSGGISSSAVRGINFASRFVPQYNDFYSMKTTSTGVAPYHPDEYINIWICNLPDDNSGFSQMPGYDLFTDGIVLDFDYILPSNKSTKYNLGHTLTHLMGNYLGLYPLWGSNGQCSDDYVTDTPMHNAPNYECPQFRHSSVCDGLREMTMNFMDNTDDACLNMFTKGQKERLQAMLDEDGPRYSLTQTSGGCGSSVTSDIALSRESLDVVTESDEQVHVYPNPATEAICVEFTENIVEGTRYKIHSINGQLMREGNLTSNRLTLGVSDWLPGVYLISVANAAEQPVSTHFIVQQK